MAEFLIDLLVCVALGVDMVRGGFVGTVTDDLDSSRQTVSSLLGRQDLASH